MDISKIKPGGRKKGDLIMGDEKKRRFKNISTFLVLAVGRWSGHSLSEMAKIQGITRWEGNE